MNFKKNIRRAVPLALILIYVSLISAGGYFDGNSTSGNFSDKDSVLFFTHRGLSVYCPENSIEGVKASYYKGFKATEVDIRRSADGQYIVFHDENCQRLLGFDKEIETMKTEDIKNHPLIFNERQSESRVATVDELLKCEGMIFYFDMKLSSFTDADNIAGLIKNNHCLKRVIVASSDFTFIFYMERYHPEIMTALEGFDAGKEWTYHLMPKKLRPDYLSGFARNINEKHVKWLNENRLMKKRIVYGVDTLNLNLVLQQGFKNIILDYDTIMQDERFSRGCLARH